MSAFSRSVEAAAARYGEPRLITRRLDSLDFPPVSERAYGEVCMAIRRPSGRFLLQTKRTYPNSIMRLPTGGIRKEEPLETALLREIWEETNLEVRIVRFVADIAYTDDRHPARFRTYMFLCDESDGVLQSNDPKEQISDWAEAGLEDLPRYAEQLRSIKPSWARWGEFRAAALEVLVEHCSKTPR